MVRVGEDYFLATSTFEWFPGVRLHRSRDLAHWTLVGHALTRTSQLDLRGVPDSGGVWAPGLSHDGALFHLVYSVVDTRRDFPLIAVTNHLVTAPDIAGPWSDPVFLGGGGWDPSLHHAADGRKYLLRMELDHRPGEPAARGIVLQEYAPDRRALVGAPRTVFRGTSLGCTEGPQLFTRAGLFYLVTAEGGTSWGHAATVARAPAIEGPYEPDPAGPLLTARDDAGVPLQKAGHASFVSTPDGAWYLAHLCCRPVGPDRRSPLGRETAIQKVVWTEDGWPRLAHGDRRPRLEVPGLPAPGAVAGRAADERDDFAGTALGPAWSALRGPIEEDWASLRARPGHLRLRGRGPLFSQHRQSLVAQRWRHHHAVAETAVDFDPETFHEAAGLVCFYDTRDYVYLCVTWVESLGKCLTIVQMDRGHGRRAAAPAPLPSGVPVHLRAEVDGVALRFAYRTDAGAGEHAGDRARWTAVGGTFDATQLSDEYGGKDGFTGAFFGLAVQDLLRHSRAADFSHFHHFTPHARSS
jgi:xylan 1,4-beta-xylosidase